MLTPVDKEPPERIINFNNWFFFAVNICPPAGIKIIRQHQQSRLVGLYPELDIVGAIGNKLYGASKGFLAPRRTSGNGFATQFC